MKKINVLFTAVCGWPTHATVNALRQSQNYEYEIVGVDCNPNPAALNYVDYLYQIPRCSDPAYIDQILAICKKHNTDIIVPLISEDITPFYDNLDRINSLGIKVLLSDRQSDLLIANDKYRLYQYLHDQKIDIMPHTTAYNADTLEQDLKDFGYPANSVAVKLKDGCGGVGFKILNDEKAQRISCLTSRTARVNPYITKDQFIDMAQNGRYLMQTYLSGSELGVLSLADNGRTICSLCHENYDMQYATTVDCELVQNKEAEDIVRKINKLLRLDGNIGYDFKRDENGKLWLLEINPRISATVSLAVKAGVNIVEMGVLHKLGLPIDENIDPLYGLRMMRVYGTLYTYKGEPYGK